MASGNQTVEVLPQGLQRKVSYNGKVMSSRDCIDQLLVEGFTSPYFYTTKQGDDKVILSNGSGNKSRVFYNKAELEYIRHKTTSTHSTVNKASDGTQLPDETVQPVVIVQEGKQGAVIQGPGHDTGGVDVKIAGKTIINAEGEEIIMNKEASKKNCQELSKMNQETGNGIAFDCEKAERGKQLLKTSGSNFPAQNTWRLGPDIRGLRTWYAYQNKMFFGTDEDNIVNDKIVDQSYVYPISKEQFFDHKETSNFVSDMKQLFPELSEQTIYDSINILIAAKGTQLPVSGPPYKGADASRQIKKELTESFPGIKFSVRYKSYSGGDSIDISWEFGPTVAQVEKISQKYQEGSFNGMDDSYTYDPTKTVSATGEVVNLGGAKYVFEHRGYTMNTGETGNVQWEKETSLQFLIAKELVKKQGKEWQGKYTPYYEGDSGSNDTAEQLAYRILVQNSFDTDDVKSFEGLGDTGVKSGNIEEFYTIKYNGDKVTTNPKATEKIMRDAEWERTKPEREAKAAQQQKEQQEKDEKLKHIKYKQYGLITEVVLNPVLFPRMNKNSTLGEYKEYLQKDLAQHKDISEKVLVEQVVIVDNKNWDLLTNSLLNDFPEIWKQIGGNRISDEDLAALNITKDQFHRWDLTESQKEGVRKVIVTLGTLLYNSDTKENIIVNTETYGYARYVGFPTDKQQVENALLNIKIPTNETTAMATTKNISAPANLIRPTSWEQLPQSWKVVKRIPKIAFDNTPYDKNLIKIVGNFAGTDNLRPVLSGMNFDTNGITPTDAHRLIHLPYPNKKFNGIYCTFPVCKKMGDVAADDKISGKYPAYENVLSEKNKHVYKISVLKLKTYVQAILMGNYANMTTHQIELAGPKDADGNYVNYAFNGNFLIQILNSCMMLGYDHVFIGLRLQHNAAVFAFEEKVALEPGKHVGKETILLLMPVTVDQNDLQITNGMPVGARDLDFNKEFRIAYSLAEDKIYNNDGTEAQFDATLAKATETDLTDQQDRIVNAYKAKNPALPILDGTVAIQDNTLMVTDLESTAILTNISKPDDTYMYINDALVSAQMPIDDYPAMYVPKEYKSLGKINRLEFLFNLAKANLCVGKDELRPVMSGIHLHKSEDTGRLIIEATNAHVLYRNELQNNTLKEINVIVPATKKLKTFLENVFDENIEVFVSGTNIMFSTDTAKVIHRLIDGKYPNTVSVIPATTEKIFTLDISNLKSCIKSLSREETKDDYTLGFSPINDGVMKIDLMKGEGYGNNYTVKLVRELCQVQANEKSGSRTKNDLVFLGMPKMLFDQLMDKYVFGIASDILEVFMKITESDELVINYTAPNRALILSDSEFKEISEAVNLPAPPAKSPKAKDVLENIATEQEETGIKIKKQKEEKETKDAYEAKIKLAKAKARAQKQRIRILALLNKKK